MNNTTIKFNAKTGDTIIISGADPLPKHQKMGAQLSDLSIDQTPISFDGKFYRFRAFPQRPDFLNCTIWYNVDYEEWEIAAYLPGPVSYPILSFIAPIENIFSEVEKYGEE